VAALIKPRDFKLHWDAHSLSGVLTGLLLFIVFYAGAFALFRNELSIWADPALRPKGPGSPLVTTLVRPHWDAHPPKQGSDVLVVFPFDGRSFYWLRYEDESGERVDRWIGADSGQALPPRGRSRLGETLYKLHYFEQLGLPGRLTAGLLAVVMGFSLITGLLIHLRKLPDKVHAFRPRKKLTTALADAHTALGTLGLPFSLMYAVTGAFFGLIIVVLAPLNVVVFEGDEGKLQSLLSGVSPPRFEASGAAAVMAPPHAFVDAVETSWGEFEPVLVKYHGWGDKNAFVTVDGRSTTHFLRSGKAVLDASTAELLDESSLAERSSLRTTIAMFTSLHFGSFGDLLGRVLFFVLSLAMAGVLLSGNVLWLSARRRSGRTSPFAHRLLERATVGIGCGLVFAIPFAFSVSRLVPLSLAGRGTYEDAALFGGWLAAAGLGALWPRRRGVRWLLAGAAVCSLLIVVLDGVVLGLWPGREATEAQLVVQVGFLTSGAALTWIAAQVGAEAPARDGPGLQDAARTAG